MLLMSDLWTTAHTFYAYTQLYFSSGKWTKYNDIFSPRIE